MCSNPEATAGFLTALVLAIGLGLSYKQLKLMKRTGQAELINNMAEYWEDSNRMMDARKELYKIKTGEAVCEALKECKEKKDFVRWLLLTRVANFFELMGNLAYRGTIDLDLLAGKFRRVIMRNYDYYKLFIDYGRKEYKQPALYEYFEWLAKKMPNVKPKLKKES